MKPPEVQRLGTATIPSPFTQHSSFIDDDAGVLVDADLASIRASIAAGRPPAWFEIAGPRQQLWFEPSQVVAGIVTCGGLCPGLNNVIRTLTLSLWHGYGVRKIHGFRYGYAGLSSMPPDRPWQLDPTVVSRIHEEGGTVLGTSRGPQELDDMMATLDALKVNVLFAIGGDGTLRGAAALADHLREHGRNIAVVGIPKTIDNDIGWVSRSFGFSTAVERAEMAIAAAHTEAEGALNGVGLVQLMGRHAGFIAATATLANHDVNFCMVPEFPVPLDGDSGFLAALERRLHRRRHAVVVAAEGCGTMVPETEHRFDASGNRKLPDVGLYLRDRIKTHMDEAGIRGTVKYIDPSYMIRSCPANAYDAELCQLLAQHAVHAALSGRTGIMIGHWHGRFTHVPISMAVDSPRRLGPEDPAWQRVLESTGQAGLFDPLTP